MPEPFPSAARKNMGMCMIDPWAMGGLGMPALHVDLAGCNFQVVLCKVLSQRSVDSEHNRM